MIYVNSRSAGYELRRCDLPRLLRVSNKTRGGPDTVVEGRERSRILGARNACSSGLKGAQKGRSGAPRFRSKPFLRNRAHSQLNLAFWKGCSKAQGLAR